MPKVEIIHFTGQQIPVGVPGDSGNNYMLYDNVEMEQQFAGRLLAFTKNTRLNMNPEGFTTYLNMPWEHVLKELDYMAGTIPSSWEFIDVTFTLQEVSRACAQQITRTRFTPMDADIFGSYAMQSFRVTELRDLSFHINPKLQPDQQQKLRNLHDEQFLQYKEAIDMGIPQQDARGLLPMDTHCNLVVKFNLRQLVDMLRTRDESLRVQGEYGDVAHQMKQAVLAIWPWSEKFFEPKDKKAIDMIESVAEDCFSFAGLTDFGDSRHELKELGTKLAKAADLLKK